MSGAPGSRWSDRPRVAAGFIVCAGTSLALDAWLRLWALPRHPRGSAGRRDAFRWVSAVWGRVVTRAVRWAARLTVVVEGTVPDDGRWLLVANHQSSLDIPFLISTFPAQDLKFVAWKELERGLPLVSLVLREGGSVCIGGTTPGQDLAALATFAAGLGPSDASAVIFPAGWLERDQPAQPFQLGSLEAVRRVSGLTILPVAIAGLERAPSIGSILGIAGARVTIRVGPPLPAEVVDADPRAAYGALQEAIYGAVRELRATS